jgi:flagellar motility protein MotE (MotC chaperone)
MASDITLAVGDGARRMTYAELAAVRGISALDVREDIRVIREALAVSAPDDREDIRTLQRVLDERDRTIAAHEETIRHLRSLLGDERRRMAEERRQLLGMLTERRRWWWRWFR